MDSDTILMKRILKALSEMESRIIALNEKVDRLQRMIESKSP